VLKIQGKDTTKYDKCSDSVCAGSNERKKQEMKESLCLPSENVVQPEVYFLSTLE